MDPLTAAGVIASLIFGLAGFVVGVVGVVSARHANALARDANRISTEANATSRDSLAQVQAAEARALEHHVVEWSSGWDIRRLFWLRNDGRHVAYSAFVRVSIDGETEDIDQSVDVEPGGVVRLQFDKASAAWTREDQERSSHRSVSKGDGWVAIHGAYRPPKHEVRIQIWWRTELKTPRDFELAGPESFSVTDP